MRRKITALVFLILMVLSFGITASAQTFDSNRTGSMSITLKDPYSKQPISGAKFNVYYVASVKLSNAGKLSYFYRSDFTECGIALDDPALAKKLANYVANKTFPSKQLVTDAAGAASCSGLELGMYLAVQREAVAGYSTCSPFMVMIPSQKGNDFTYDVNASPKTDVVKLMDITIKKVWNTGKTSQIPGSVTVRLYRDGEAVSSSVLNKDNNWQVVLKDLPSSDGYTVKEINVPQGFTATYKKSGNTFTVTNSASLAQTGQLIWPIPVLAMTGLFFLVLGAALLRKSGTDYA